MNPDDLRATLAEAIPEAPTPEAWAARARAGYRRRRTLRTTLAAAASVAVVAGGIAVWQTRPVLRAVPDAASFAPAALDCATISPPPANLSTTVPNGAASVTLCNGHHNQGAGEPPVVPPDALVSHVDEVAALVNAGGSSVGACTANLSPSFTLVFTYRDRPPVLVTGELFGCGTVAGRTGAEAVKTRFLDLLVAQRKVLPPPPRTTPLPASQMAWSWIRPELTDTVSGVLLTTVAEQQIPPVTLAGWDAIAAASARAERGPPAEVMTGATSSVIAVNPWGESTRLHLHDRDLSWAEAVVGTPETGRRQTWARVRLSEAEYAPIAAALATAEAAAPPRLCAAHRRGWAGDTAAVRIVRCTEGAGGVVVERELNQKMVELVTEDMAQRSRPWVSPPTPQPCSPDVREWIVLLDAAGRSSVLEREACLSSYRTTGGVDRRWEPSAEIWSWWESLRPR